MSEQPELIGTMGAYRQTWRKGNPRSLLQTIINKNPKADEKKIHQLFWEEIEDDKELLRACVEYWLDHNYRSIIFASTAPTPEQIRRKQTERTEGVKAATNKLKERIEFETKRRLLDWIMPNERRLGDCTGKECRLFGGWLGEVGKKVPANSTVRQVLSEEQLQKLWKK